jgi:Rhs element Vgr protein
MANSPLHKIEDTTLLVNLKIEGKDMKDIYAIQSIKVNHAINKISTTEIVFLPDVDIASGKIEMTDGDDFNPGKIIEIFAGYTGTESNSIFKGVIVKQIVRLDKENSYSFIIECRHEAVKMSFTEKDRFFENQPDDKVISNIIGEYNIRCTVGNSIEQQEISFQKRTTDWDFIVARCTLNGMIVTLDGSAGMLIDAPKLDAPSVLTIEAGIDMISFDGTVSAENQPSAVNTHAWDPKTLSLLKASATEPVLNKQGNINVKDLSSAPTQSVLNLVSATPLTTGYLKTWANSILQRKRLGAFTGNVQFIGNSMVKTGSLIEIKGVGKKLSGQAFVSAVKHSIDSGNWLTTVTFGLEEQPANENKPSLYITAYGRLTTPQGLQLATVKKIEPDTGNLYRIQIEIPSASDNQNYSWARMAHPYASNKSGSFFLPEIGDEVVFGFLDNDPCHPIILGSLYNGKNDPPYTPATTNNIKAFVTRSKMKLEFDEEKKSIRLLTPGKNSIVISDDEKYIEMKDQHNNSFTLNADGISINSAGDIKISALRNIQIDATGNIKAIATNDLALQGLTVNINAQTQLIAKGNASAEFSAAGETTLKGAIVMIN